MGVIKSVSAVVLVLVLAVVSFRAGLKMAPRVLVLDQKTGQEVPLVAPDGAVIIVLSPSGFEPGVYAAHSKDNKSILILPPSLIPSADKQTKDSGRPDPEMSNGERLDRASL